MRIFSLAVTFRFLNFKMILSCNLSGLGSMAAAIILVPTYLQCIHKSYYSKGMVVVVAVLINTRQCNHHNDHRRVA